MDYNMMAQMAILFHEAANNSAKGIDKHRQCLIADALTLRFQVMQFVIQLLSILQLQIDMHRKSCILKVVVFFRRVDLFFRRVGVDV